MSSVDYFYDLDKRLSGMLAKYVSLIFCLFETKGDGRAAKIEFSQKCLKMSEIR